MRFSEAVESFSKQTTVHGLHIVGFPKLHILERLFWIVMVALATLGAVAIGYSNWMHYSASPTVVSIQKDFRNWLNPFPAATVCSIKKIDKKKVDKYIQDTWGINLSHPDYTEYLNFIRVATNVSFQNLKGFSRFKDNIKLQNVDILRLIEKVHPNLSSGTLVTFEAKQKTLWIPILTELGLCYSVNSMFMDFLSLQHNVVFPKQKILRCHYLNGLCYARYDSDPDLPLKYYIHSFLEIVHTTSDAPLIVHESEELEINYRMQETESSPSLRYLSPSQRKCRFYDEPNSDIVPMYSISLCYMVCRYKIALKLCGCKPFFYHKFEGKVCDLKGLICLGNHSDYLSKPLIELGCDCPPPCDLITYFQQVPKITKWEYGYFEQRITFRWALLAPTTKFRREVLFGFEDLVVSFGGTLALFLGISFMSAIEIIFLMCENIYIFCKQNKNNTVRKITFLQRSQCNVNTFYLKNA